ncbi:MAG: glycosyltransferase [Planctomycetota bacterium]|nr:MAG: glycosyltransferase [Planctomycetota bacterium]
MSWLMPVRNAMPYLPAALESIARQTYCDAEVLAWDNGSTDGSREVLSAWVGERLPGRAFLDRPLALGASRARLVEESKGEYLAFLDADDVAEPSRLARQVAVLDASPELVAVGSAARIIDGEGRSTGETWRYPTDPREARWELFFANCLVTSSVLARRAAILAAGNFRALDAGEDYELWLRLLERGEVRSLPEPLVRYRRHPKSVSSASSGAERAARARRLARAHAARLFPGVPRAQALRVWEERSPYGGRRGPGTWRSVRIGHRMARAMARQRGWDPADVVRLPAVERVLTRPRRRDRLREGLGRLGARAAGLGLGAGAHALARTRRQRSGASSLRRVVFVVSEGFSLDAWARLGLLERHLAYFRRYLEVGIEVTLVSPAGAVEERYRDALGGIRLGYGPPGLSPDAYRVLLPLVHGRTFAAADAIVSLQVRAGAQALRAARLWGRPFVARAGYLPSLNAEAAGASGEQVRREAEREDALFAAAARVLVTSPRMADALARRGAVAASRVRVVPNPVDVDRFRPNPEVRPEVDVVCVAGLRANKNLSLLLDAVVALSASAWVIGDGPLGDWLRARYVDQPRIRFLGCVPNEELPALLQRARVFAFPTRYEGHPKAVLEALACGLPVVATAVPGVADLVEHGRTALLAPLEGDGFRAALARALSDPTLAARLGAAGRRLAVERFASERVHTLEREAIEEAAREGVAPEPGSLAAWWAS